MSAPGSEPRETRVRLLAAIWSGCCSMILISGAVMVVQASTPTLPGAPAVAVANVLDAMKDAETGQRGFLLTDREAFLEPYVDATSRVGRDLAALRILAERNRHAADLVKLVDRKLVELADKIARRRAGEPIEKLDIAAGKLIMDQIRVVGAEMLVAENAQATARVVGRLACWVLAIAVVVTVAVSLVVARIVEPK